MKLPLFIFFSLLTLFCFSQQTEQSFVVKKNGAENKKGVPRIIDLQYGAVGDTICGSVRIDFSSALGTYDSISLFNLKIMDKEMLMQNKRWYFVIDNFGRAIISLYKKQKNGNYKPVWFRNWVVSCKKTQ